MNRNLEFKQVGFYLDTSEARRWYGNQHLSFYNPSSVFNGMFFIRVEPFPYSAELSTVWLAEIESEEEERILAKLIKPITDISPVYSYEDPTVLRIGNDFFLSIVISDKRTYYQEIYSLEFNSSEKGAPCLREKIHELPPGLKGLRFYDLGDRIILFTRPQGEFLLKDRRKFIKGEKGKVGYKLIKKSEFDLKDMLQRAYSEPANALICPSEGWVGVNELIPDLRLLIYHKADFSNDGRKIYKACISHISFSNEIPVLDEILTVSRHDFDIQTGYEPNHELYDIVYPSGFYKSESGYVYILLGISDNTTGCFKLEFRF